MKLISPVWSREEMALGSSGNKSWGDRGLEKKGLRNQVEDFGETEAPDGATVEARLRFGHWAATSAELETAQRDKLRRDLSALDRENKILQRRLEGRADIVQRAVEGQVTTPRLELEGDPGPTQEWL